MIEAVREMWGRFLAPLACLIVIGIALAGIALDDTDDDDADPDHEDGGPS